MWIGREVNVNNHPCRLDVGGGSDRAESYLTRGERLERLTWVVPVMPSVMVVPFCRSSSSSAIPSLCIVKNDKVGTRLRDFAKGVR